MGGKFYDRTVDEEKRCYHGSENSNSERGTITHLKKATYDCITRE
jgi:hypothetical protein